MGLVRFRAGGNKKATKLILVFVLFFHKSLFTVEIFISKFRQNFERKFNIKISSVKRPLYSIFMLLMSACFCCDRFNLI